MTGSSGEQGAATWVLVRLGLALFFTMNVMVFTMALWSQDIYGQPGQVESNLAATLFGLFRYLGLFFALPVIFLLGGPLLENCLANLRRGQITTDLLLLIGVAASYLFSAYSVLSEHGPVYFEVGCIVLVLVTLGRWLEATGKLRTTQALEALEKLLPDTVRLVRDFSLPPGGGGLGWGGERSVACSSPPPSPAEGEGEKNHIPIGQVQIGNRLHVLAGERIPCDGLVLEHPVHVDEQILTGESGSQVREIGEQVWAGTLNLDSDLFLEVNALPSAGALARLVQMMRQARLRKGHFERMADRITRWFLPGVVLAALASLIGHAWLRGLDQGILASLAVLLIACPCALGIATPLAVWVGMGEAAKMQVVIQSGDVLERLASLRALCFDKTGTLTTGMAHVEQFTVAEERDRPAILSLAKKMALSSTHGLARAIAAYAKDEPDQDSATSTTFLSPSPPPANIRTLSGRGLFFSQGDQEFFLGSDRLMREKGLNFPQVLENFCRQALQEAKPLVCLGYGDQVRGIFAFREVLRPETHAALVSLQDMGLQVTVLTGDHAARGAALARELNVTVQAELLPEDKLTGMEGIRKKIGSVGMVGDGINDGPALAASDVGVAMGCGADLARASAGVCLLGNDLTRIPWVIDLARRTVKVVKQNLFWAFIYNLVGIGLAASGLLNPIFAALAMVLSSFFVVSNSMRLGHQK